MSNQQLINYLQHTCSPAGREEVEAWINASEENMQAYLDLKKVWEAAETVPDAIRSHPLTAWKNIAAKTGIKEPARKKVIHTSFMRWAKIAAVLVVLAGIGILIRSVYPGKIKMQSAIATNEKKEVRLTDGTIVYLNRSSRIMFPERFDGSTREIDLEGEAFFKVKRDTLRPFIVHAGGTDTKVLGTSFNIQATDTGAVYVSVLTGKVSFQPGNNTQGSLNLEKGQQGYYSKKNQILKMQSFSDENFLSWQTGILHFTNRTLAEVVKELSAYYETTIEVIPALQHRLITVSFDNLGLQQALEILEITLAITIDKTPGKIILK